MNDYIRKAVELADGWGILTEFGFDYIQIAECSAQSGLKEPFQAFLDALAAQLVRQVDAGRSEDLQIAVEVSFGCTVIWMNGTRTHSAHSPDRPTVLTLDINER